jgi:hypothetical protein
MDVFTRTFLPATSEAGLPTPVVSRHMPVLRRSVSPDETTVLVARSRRPRLPMTGAFLLLLTNRQLVVSRESWLLHRVRLHLAAQLRDLSQVAWTADPRAGVELSATAADGVRERFWIPSRDPRRVRHLDALFSYTFSPGPWRPTQPGAVRRGAAHRARSQPAPFRFAVPARGTTQPDS